MPARTRGAAARSFVLSPNPASRTLLSSEDSEDMSARTRGAAARSFVLSPRPASRTLLSSKDDCEFGFSSGDGGSVDSTPSSSIIDNDDEEDSGSVDSTPSSSIIDNNDEEDSGSDDSRPSPAIESDDEEQDEEDLKAAWRSQLYVPGTRARHRDNLASMKRWIDADESRRKKFLPIVIPFTDTLCIQYLNHEMRRKLNKKGDLLAPGTIYQVQRMLIYEGELKSKPSLQVFSFESTEIYVITIKTMNTHT
jgi:hypothetical protein